MKKFFLLLLACATLTGCEDKQEELFNDTSQKKISFQVAKFRTSRADEKINGTKFEYDHFVTHAWSAASAADDNVFMDHQRVVKTSDGSAWMPERDYYWPNYSTVDFISYYPENADKNCPVVEREKLTYTGYDVSGDKADITVATNDLMYAEKAVGYSGNIDDVNDDNGGTHDSGYSGVPTLFHHALAQLEIRILVRQPAGESESRWEAVVDHAKLDGYYTKGDLELTLKQPDLTHGVTGWQPAGEENVGWTLSADATTTSQQIIESASPVTVSSTGSGTGYVTDTRGGCMSIFKAFVLPQTLTDQHRFELKYTLNKYRGNNLETSEADTEVRKILLKTDLIPHWGMNQKIVYTIIINPGQKILFDPAVVDWEDVIIEKSAEDILRPTYYFAIPTDWDQSNVWHAYDAKGNNIAEVARELVGNPAENAQLYRSVVAYPSANEYANLSKGLIAQVTDMTSGSNPTINRITNKAGGSVAWTPRNKVDALSTSYVTNLTWGTEADYPYVLIAPDGTLSLARNIPTGAKEATVKPYTVTDIDGNVYPVVKIAASYWLRENLRVTRYNDGTPLTQRRTITDLSTITNLNEPAAGHAYVPEKVPTYDWYSNNEFDAATASDEIKKRYGLNYNYCAVVGSADPEIKMGYGAYGRIKQQGDPTLTTPTTNKQLAPQGWHISTNSQEPMFDTDSHLAFDNKICDINYVDEYIRWKWRHLMSETTGTRNYATAQWEAVSGYPITNLSGFSMYPVPALGQKDGYKYVSFFDGPTFKNGEMQNNMLFMHDCIKLAPNGAYYWNMVNVLDNSLEMLGFDWQLGTSPDDITSFNSSADKLRLEQTVKQSLPVRCVRN